MKPSDLREGQRFTLDTGTGPRGGKVLWTGGIQPWVIMDGDEQPKPLDDGDLQAAPSVDRGPLKFTLTHTRVGRSWVDVRLGGRFLFGMPGETEAVATQAAEAEIDIYLQKTGIAAVLSQLQGTIKALELAHNIHNSMKAEIDFSRGRADVLQEELESAQRILAIRDDKIGLLESQRDSAFDDVREERAEVAKLREELEEARLTLLNERGEGAPPSPGWEWNTPAGCWQIPGSASVVKSLSGKYWRLTKVVKGQFGTEARAKTARKAMRLTDSASAPSMENK